MQNFMVRGFVDPDIFVDLGENWTFFEMYGISYIFCNTFAAAEWQPLGVERRMSPFWKLER